MRYIRLRPGPAGHVELLHVDLVEAGGAKPIADVLDGAPFRVGSRPPWTDHVAQLPRVFCDLSAGPGLTEEPTIGRFPIEEVCQRVAHQRCAAY